VASSGSVAAATTAAPAKKLEPVISLSGYSKIDNILVLGCGGTGGHLVPHLARLVSVLNSKRSRSAYASLPVMNLFLADGDVVEEKNLIRQNFIEQDIGKNKAEVLGERYAAAFGIEIGVIPEYLERLDKFSFLKTMSRSYDNASLVIGCVDNNASRKVINRWFCRKDTGGSDGRFWIDSGNEENSGQVVCGYNPQEYRYGQPKFNPFRKDLHSLSSGRRRGDFCLPCAVEVYPELLHIDDSFSSQESCAARSQSAPQNMQTNVTAAVIIMNFVQKLITRDLIKSHCVEFAISNTFNTRLNTVKNLECVAKGRRKDWEKSQ